MVDCCSVPGLLPFEQALENMLTAINPIDETEPVTLKNALGRVLAQDIKSPVNVPPNDNSAMDGYTFSQQSLAINTTLKLVGRSMAGSPFVGECKVGECVRIMTGAKVPADCDTVEMQENCQVEGENVTFLSPRKHADNVRSKGEDIGLGQAVFLTGRELTAIDIGVLASLGIDNVTVFRKLKVALISTGDELKKPGQALNDGDIYESNSQFLTAILTKLGADIIDFGIIEDVETSIFNAFKKADEVADVVISSGGVSVGDADYTKTVLESLGEIAFWKIAMKPGKPFAFGTLPNSYFFGLPGNPVSALVTAHQLALPALLKLQNVNRVQALTLNAKTTSTLKKSPGRMDFQRGIVSNDENGNLQVTSTGSQGSGILTSMAAANCYIVLAAEQGQVSEGEWVKVQMFDKYLQ
ncbi:molybdopterin molybdotransferase MoeA [Colwellia sp. 1_MG-2023]|uniref:molybdopterin molybdotransferase MoeA n=1 Tax=Colwellia sp. 1_MG-2023 TaxID=3062649 RepID=UPI0026E15C81|nr:molybdopterin molybdotransferase MoeA [Colwellia sp. 1_MG-2023]MDO6446542.1 molybdopterin molybdotransferase MoeA [Colwellia sp. 1_MG-2023]